MRDQEILDLTEAYASIYKPSTESEYFTEEVEIAAEYFYNLGLNEEGVALVVEEIGSEEFYQWVQDLSEEYYLDEARRSGSIEPKTAKGQDIKGKPSASSLKRLRKLKAERKASEEKASEEKPSGLTASLKRQSAVANAKKQQPKKRGVLDRIAGEVLKGVERHKAAMSAARETGKTIGKAAKGAGEVAKGFASGLSGTARLAGHLASKGLGEEVDVFDCILEYLISEGYADTEENALVIMTNMSEEWRDSIVEGMTMDDFKKQRSRLKRNEKRAAEKTAPGRRAGIHSPSASPERAARHRANVDPDFEGNDEDQYPGGPLRPKKKRKAAALGELEEGVDLFDVILEHLVSEGYADTNEAALVIMANMSEEWKQSIVEQASTVSSSGGAGGKVTVNKSYPATLNKQKGVKSTGPTGTEYFTPNFPGSNVPNRAEAKFKSVASQQYEKIPSDQRTMDLNKPVSVTDRTKYDPSYKPPGMRK